VFENVLIQEGVPYKIWGAFKFFSRMEVKDIIAYVKRFLNPQDNVSLKRIINTPNRKIGDTTMEKIAEHALQRSFSLYEVVDQMWKGQIPPEELKLTPQAMTGIKSFLLAM
jgi:DNA helicase-2/ATP-dependent DNA helicase PcrA